MSINLNNYTLFLTVVDRAPGLIDLFLYLEDAYKRPMLGQGQVIIEDPECNIVFNNILEPDKDGIMFLRYISPQPLKCRLKVSAGQMGYSGQWIETTLSLGSPGISMPFMLILGLIFLVAFILTHYLPRRHREHGGNNPLY